MAFVWRLRVFVFLPLLSDTAGQDHILDPEDCRAALLSKDINRNGGLSSDEYFEVLSDLSPFAGCPNANSPFLINSAFQDVFDELVCSCLDFPSLDPPTGAFDPLCCDRSGPEFIRLALTIYPDAYESRLCRYIASALSRGCDPTNPPTKSPTMSPTGAPVVPVTEAPTPVTIQTDSPTGKWYSFGTSSPVASRVVEPTRKSILGLSGIWNILAFLAFAVCAIVAFTLIFVFVRSLAGRDEIRRPIVDEEEVDFSGENMKHEGENENEDDEENQQGIHTRQFTADTLDDEEIIEFYPSDDTDEKEIKFTPTEVEASERRIPIEPDSSELGFTFEDGPIPKEDPSGKVEDDSIQHTKATVEDSAMADDGSDDEEEVEITEEEIEEEVESDVEEEEEEVDDDDDDDDDYEEEEEEEDGEVEGKDEVYEDSEDDGSSEDEGESDEDEEEENQRTERRYSDSSESGEDNEDSEASEEIDDTSFSIHREGNDATGVQQNGLLSNPSPGSTGSDDPFAVDPFLSP